MTFTARAENKNEEEWSARNATYKGPSRTGISDEARSKQVGRRASFKAEEKSKKEKLRSQTSDTRNQ